MKNIKRYIWVILFAGILIAGDLLIKHFVFKSLQPGGSKTIIGGFLFFERVENRGGVFGILPGKQWLLILITALLMLILIAIYVQTKWKKSKLFSIAYALVFAGAAGNLVDRILFGYVRDFIHLDFFPYVFNFADICITIGAALLVLFILFFAARFNKKNNAKALQEQDKQ